MCEETQHPATQVPKAMVLTILMNTLAGLMFLVPLCFVTPDMSILAGLLSGQPVPTIIKNAVGSPGGSLGVLIPLMVLAIFCGIGCTTASSRCAWAFARDGAIPFSKQWMKVNKKLDVPVNAMVLCMVVELVLGLIYFGSPVAFNAFSGVGVISLTFSYAIPIAISLLTGRHKVRNAKFPLGKLGVPANIIAIGMCSMLCQLFKASLMCQRGLLSPCLCSACRRLSPLQPKRSTTLRSSSSRRHSFLVFGT